MQERYRVGELQLLGFLNANINLTTFWNELMLISVHEVIKLIVICLKLGLPIGYRSLFSTLYSDCSVTIKNV